MYKPFSFTSNATDRVEQLMMPDELLYNKRTYNEILILEHGRTQTDIDSRIPKLKKSRYIVSIKLLLKTLKQQKYIILE